MLAEYVREVVTVVSTIINKIKSSTVHHLTNISAL